MKKKEWNEGLNHLDIDLVEKYVEQKEKLSEKKQGNHIGFRLGAIAACFCLIVGMVYVAPMLQTNDPIGDDTQYSAEDIAKLFNGTKTAAISTNAYRKIYVPDPQYLYIDKIPKTEDLGIYRYSVGSKGLDKRKLQEFIDSFLPGLTDSLGVDAPQYTITTTKYFSGEMLEAEETIGTYRMYVQQHETQFRLGLYQQSDDKRIVLDGETVQIDQRLSDDEIINSIQSIKNKLFDIFHVSFSETKIIRSFDSYSEHGAEYISIYFYNNDPYGLNSTQRVPISDYIEISFDNIDNYLGDRVSDSILSVASISYIKNRMDISQKYQLIANAKKISLEDAENLLYHGYVFGGHSCPLCMAEQDKISFDGYDFVDIEYVFDFDWETDNPATGIPFYAFYKEIGTSFNGNTIYAKTYVPAIEVSGYTEYFQNQQKYHQRTDYEEDK